MSPEELLRGFFALILGAALAWAIYTRDDSEMQDADISPLKLYSPIIAPWLLPFFAVTLFAVLLLAQNAEYAVTEVFTEFFGVFLHIGVYYAVLLLFLPLLRRHVSAKAAAVLWLLPNYLYVTMYSYMKLDKPAFVLHIPAGENTVRIIIAIWLVGFAGVMAVSFVRHFAFRSFLLREAQAVTYFAVANQWEREQKRAGIKKANIRLVISDQASSPLTVGLFRATMRVILPKKEYTEKELELIFRHELIHIVRADAWTKFFLRFCTAVCWFNPLLWIAMRKCADDLELSCDELVLTYADEAARRQYAALILSSACDERGFTTCLSANAEALKYRLGGILNPKRKFVGGILAGVIFFLLIVTSGYAALAYGSSKVEDVLFNSDRTTVRPDFETVTISEGNVWKTYVCKDYDALTDYIADRKISYITGNYAFQSERRLLLMYNNDEGLFSVILGENTVKGSYLSARTAETYYLDQPVDWEYVMSLLEPYVEPEIILPELYLNFGGWNNGNVHDFVWAGRKFVAETVNGEAIEPRNWFEEGQEQPSVIEGFPVEAVELIFPMVPETYRVLVKSIDGSAEYTVDGETLNTFMLPLAPYSANYKVFASFDDAENGLGYEMEFYFKVTLPEEAGRDG